MTVTHATPPGATRAVGFGDLVRIPLRRWRVAASAATAVVLAAGGYLLMTPPTYAATAVVVVRPVNADPFAAPNGNADRAVNMTAESGIATGSDIVDAAAKATQMGHRQTNAALEVEAPTGGQVLRFTFTGANPKQAIDGANTAAQAYLDVRRAMYEQQRASVLKSLDDTVGAVTKQREAAKAVLPVNSATPRASALLDQVRALNGELSQLAEQRARIATADLTPGSVTSVAREPVNSSSDQAPLLLLAALLGGLIVGAVAAYARDTLDRRLSSAAEAAQLTGLGVLGTIARPTGDGARTDLRYLALALSPWIDRESPEPLVMLSGRDDEGRSEISAGLAAALAEVGYDVYLGGTSENESRLRGVLTAAQRRAEPVPSRHRRVRAIEPETVRPLELVPLRGTAAAGPDGTDEAAAGSAAVLTLTEVVPGESAEVVPDATVTEVEPEAAPDATVTEVVPDAAPDATVTGTAPDAAVTQVAPDATVTDVTPAEAADTSSAEVLTATESTVRIDRGHDDQNDLMVIGAGTVRLGRLGLDTSERVIVVLDAPAARNDDRGVWAARAGTGLVVATVDHSCPHELQQLTDRLRAANVPPAGLVVVGSGRG